MNSIILLFKRFPLTIVTSLIILYLTFFKPVGLDGVQMMEGFDKLVHLVMYFTLCAVFWYESLKITLKPKFLYMALFSVVLPIVFSGLMEYLQYVLTSYRTGDFEDFIFNAIGVVLALFFSLLVTKPIMKRRVRK